MKIYSDVLDVADLYNTSGINIQVTPFQLPRCRVRRKGWRVVTYGLTGARRKNTGDAGAGYQPAASWDAHGWWMARLFARDPDAVIVASCRYNGREDFEVKTKGKYRSVAAAMLETAQ